MSETELIPAWDDDGAVRPLDAESVHRRGLRHMAVSVLLVSGGRTLLCRRAAGLDRAPGLWAPACWTHPRWSEHYAVAAARGLRAALGLTGLNLRKHRMVEYRAGEAGAAEHEVVQPFTAAAEAAALRLSPDPALVAETRWAGLDALHSEIAAQPGAFLPWLRLLVTEHLPPHIARPQASPEGPHAP